ncbi:uncharacterized protein ARMOST_06256 [Armillaria ostoyae]|uniref:Uncharacterized protein n=1 Tax=Armillaria ostoyae TaxID=47428 RepID=A0A284R2J8_ARMOS|nr:uncharacterized protein ARMOST_06256 [Armillaria ostoyae]
MPGPPVGGLPPPFPIPPMISFWLGRNPYATPPWDPAISYKPWPLNAPPLLWRNTAGTYGLTTAAPPLMNYPHQGGYWYPPDLVPGWRMPIPWNPLKDWRLQLLSHPNSPPPCGQWAASPLTPYDNHAPHPEPGPSPVRTATPTPRTPLPLSESESETLRLLPQPLPEETATPSIPMAPITSGLHSPPSTNKSSAPTAPRPGSYEDTMSRLASALEAMIEFLWTGTSPSIEEA